MKKILALSLALFAVGGTGLFAEAGMKSWGPFALSLYIGGGGVSSSMDELSLAGVTGHVGFTIGPGWIFTILGVQYASVLGGPPSGTQRTVHDAFGFMAGAGIQLPFFIHDLRLVPYTWYAWTGGIGLFPSSNDQVNIRLHNIRVGLIIGSSSRVAIGIEAGVVVPYLVRSSTTGSRYTVAPTPIAGIKLIRTWSGGW